MKKLALQYSHIVESSNSELRLRWPQIIAKNQHQPGYQHIRNFLSSQVRTRQGGEGVGAGRGGATPRSCERHTERSRAMTSGTSLSATPHWLKDRRTRTRTRTHTLSSLHCPFSCYCFLFSSTLFSVILLLYFFLCHPVLHSCVCMATAGLCTDAGAWAGARRSA